MCVCFFPLNRSFHFPPADMQHTQLPSSLRADSSILLKKSSKEKQGTMTTTAVCWMSTVVAARC